MGGPAPSMSGHSGVSELWIMKGSTGYQFNLSRTTAGEPAPPPLLLLCRGPAALRISMPCQGPVVHAAVAALANPATLPPQSQSLGFRVPQTAALVAEPPLRSARPLRRPCHRIATR